MAGSCRLCGKVNKTLPYGPQGRAWWRLNDYHGLFGYFCPDCFDMVEWLNGQPKHPEKYESVKDQLRRY